MNNPFFYLLLGLAVVWIGSYFYSLQHNRRKLRWLAQWLREALPILGSGTTSRWQGADRLDVLLSQGRGPIRESAIVLGMQSRQFFRLLLSLVRGGRDSLSVLVSLTNPPQAGNEFEIFEAAGPLPQTLVAAPQTWQTEDFRASHKIAFRTEAAHQSARQVLTLAIGRWVCRPASFGQEQRTSSLLDPQSAGFATERSRLSPPHS